MDIDRMIADETARERQLWDALKQVELDMAPMEARRKAACATWCRSKERLDALKLAKSITDAPVASATGDDAAVLDADRRELAAREPSATQRSAS